MKAQDVLPSDPEGAIRDARERIASGDMNGAIKRLAEYVAGHPRDAAPMRFLGDLYFRSGENARAEFIYGRLLAAHPGDRETHNRLGTVYAAEGRVDDAIHEFNAALPGTDSVGDLVRLHQRRGDLEQYRRDMQRLADLFPSDANIQAELGQVYAAVHQPYLATTYFRRALDSDSSSLTAINGLGLALMDEYDYGSAIEQFKRCLRLDEASFTCTDNLGAAQLQALQYDVAEKTLTRARALEPERSEPLVNFGYLADARGDWKAAIAYYAKAIEMWPYSREAYVDIGISYEAHQLYPLAQAALIKGITAVPDDGRLHVLLGQAYESQGERAKAIAEYRAAEKSNDPDVVRISQERFAKLEGAPVKPQ
ncbi:MAG: tetratricopeptide repeat protein [Candidatus Eremiobacteraeota bacterium]|nr:tetratricopeptide repeat protein [Candidatus Eremiobacteraeota bacterium]